METKSTSLNFPRDIFLSLLNFGMLYVSVVACIELLFQYVEFRFPDALTFSFRATSDNIRTSASILLVAYPVFLVSSWFIRKIIREYPGAAEFKPRKWLTYLTLFAAGVTMIVDLIILFDKFWGGEITPRFIIKVVIVLLVGVALLGYFLWELKNVRQSLPIRKILAWGTLAAVLAVIGMGFLIVGSPEVQRERRFDDIRIQNLDSLYWQIIYYYQANAALPKTFQDLATRTPGFIVPRDPETQSPYQYNPNDNTAFELCAVFSQPSISGGTNSLATYPASDPLRAWTHTAGLACFRQMVSPGMIPQNSSLKPAAPPLIHP